MTAPLLIALRTEDIVPGVETEASVGEATAFLSFVLARAAASPLPNEALAGAGGGGLHREQNHVFRRVF